MGNAVSGSDHTDTSEDRWKDRAERERGGNKGKRMDEKFLNEKRDWKEIEEIWLDTQSVNLHYGLIGFSCY